VPNPVGWVDPFGLSCKEIITYRGDRRDPDIVFKDGFQPRGHNTDIYEYAAKNEPSIFVSTSSNPDVAIDFATVYGTQDGAI